MGTEMKDKAAPYSLRDMLGRYHIASRADLPAEMHGIFTFDEAFQLCSDWNRQHCARDVAWPERETSHEQPKR